MLVYEESIVLQYLRRQPLTSLTELVRQCIPGGSVVWGERILSQLEWLGYITRFSGQDGQEAMVAITPRGLQAGQSRRGDQAAAS